ncbi:hypothetical protein MF406_11555 [Georgenia sp. TF02-10]|uniref:hypothetical protein n=1 Tax=Georgenia sp. TF02-10 TaxID=2917725 RepID=UPI001FA72090|nr:hypothetical protein [Georgenia sp. TF02-10]UNX53625.1 hypothetical protein MF406_11555 [Georgenia sp. TF02-10]
MTAAADVLNTVVPVLVRVARRPGAVLLTVAGAGVVLFALLGLLLGTGGTGWPAWIPFGCAVLLAVPVLVLAVRRWRLQAQTADLAAHPTVGPASREVVAVGGERAGATGAGAGAGAGLADLDALNAALAESSIRTARFLPRVEAAQRAARAAAGGPVAAPYLADDLRVTIVALLGTLAAAPLSAVGALVTALLLLLG